MNRTMLLVPMCVATFTACAPIAKSDGDNNVIAAGTYYCSQTRLQQNDGALTCNWSETMNAGCHASQARRIATDTVSTGPSRARRCENGEWLVEVTKR